MMTITYGVKDDFLGQRFGRLTVLCDLGIITAASGKYRKRKYQCRCDCGAITSVYKGQLTRGLTRSCGCFFRESLIARNTAHGQSDTKLFKLWQGIISRCEIKSATGYKNYGARGVKVCSKWRASFEEFASDVGPRPSPSHSIDRRDNNGDYTPENCVWATRLEQTYNSRRVVLHTYLGVTASQSTWARAAGISQAVLGNRLRKGWGMADGLTRITQVGGNGGRGITEIMGRVSQELGDFAPTRVWREEG